MAYVDDFLGITIPLPSVRAERSANVLFSPLLTPEGLAQYPNYAVVTDAEKRSPLYVAAMIDISKLTNTSRTNNWRTDSRIGHDFQLNNDYYRNNLWDRGHMAMRSAQAWGDTGREAQKAADETFYYSNSCLQHENLNQDEWLELEEEILHTNDAKDGKVIVFCGPIYGEESRTIRPSGREPAEIPAGFFKVIVFINDGNTTPAKKSQLDVRAYIMLQDEKALRDKRGRDLYPLQQYQVSIREVETLTGLEFDDAIYEANPIFFHENDDARNNLGVTSFPERVDNNGSSDVIHSADQPRVPAMDDKIDIYILAAQVAPKGGADEWVSILNLKNDEVDLKDWVIKDRMNRQVKLTGKLQPGESKVFAGADLKPVLLANKGGLIVLLNDKGEHVDRVDYTEKEVKDAKGKAFLFPSYRS